MAKDDKHSGLDDVANLLDPLHEYDFLYGDDDGYTTFDEYVNGEFFESEHKKTKHNEEDTMDYDDYDDIDNDEDEFDAELEHFSEEENTPNTQSGITFSFSFPPEKRTIPEDGFWKYYDESFDYWDLKLALIEHFPELRENYDEETDCSGSDIIGEVFEYAPEDAVKYLRWLWNYFPAQEINAVSKDGTTSIRKDIIVHLINERGEEKQILRLLKEEDFIKAYFEDSKWKKHDTWSIDRYVELFANTNDYENVVKYYELALKLHGDCFSNRDLNEFWDNFIVLNFMTKDAPAFIKKYIKKELNRLLPESKKALRHFKEIVESE